MCCARAGRAAAKQGLRTAANGGWCVSHSPCGKQVTLSCHPVNKAVCHSSALSRAQAASCSHVCTAAHGLSREQELLVPPGALRIRSGMCCSAEATPVPQPCCGRAEEEGAETLAAERFWSMVLVLAVSYSTAEVSLCSKGFIFQRGSFLFDFLSCCRKSQLLAPAVHKSLNFNPIITNLNLEMPVCGVGWGNCSASNLPLGASHQETGAEPGPAFPQPSAAASAVCSWLGCCPPVGSIPCGLSVDVLWDAVGGVLRLELSPSQAHQPHAATPVSGSR